MKYKDLAEFIIKNVGGEDNINNLQHCATRLRFDLKDEKKANKENIKNNESILQVLFAGGQFQIVIGTYVADVYRDIMSIINIENNETKKKNKKFLDKVFALFSGIFTPFVPVLAGAGLLRGILTILTSTGLLGVDSGTYTILFAAADTILYFLPLYLAITSARYFKVNEFIALTIGGSLLYPTILKAFNEGISLDFLGANIILIKYASSVVPIIISVFVLSLLDKFLRKFIPAIVRNFFVPLLDLMIMIPLTLLAIGPVFTFATNFFTDSFLALYGFSPIIFGLILGVCWHPLVIFGLHRGFIPINLNNLATTGKEPILAITMPSNFAQTGASLAVAFKSKNKNFKSVALANVIPGLFGITEPIVYGVTLKAKRTFYYSCIMAGIGGAIIAWAGCYAIGLPSGGILATPIFAEHALVWYIIACLVAFIGTFVLTITLGFEDIEEEINQSMIEKEEKNIKNEVINAPVPGQVVKLEEVSDSTFSSLALGSGVAIIPSQGELKSPCDGRVVAVFPTKHAIGIKSDNGAEILLHVGIDTIKMGGKGFQSFVSEGDRIEVGQLLLKFNIEEIKQKGLDSTVMMIVTNTKDYQTVEVMEQSSLVSNDQILILKKEVYNNEIK